MTGTDSPKLLIPVSASQAVVKADAPNPDDRPPERLYGGLSVDKG
jgi:hypothetical protein